MKTTKLVAFGIISMTVLGLGAQGAQAASFNGDAHGYVQLNDTWEESGIVDPPTVGPETIVPPVTPPVVGTKDLALMYYPDFQFGEADYDEQKGNTLYAEPMTGKINGEGADVERPLFVQVRSTVDWTLTAQAGQFKNNADASNVLTGAQIIIKNITPQKNTATDVGSEATAGALKTITSTKDGSTMQGLDISAGAQTIGTMTGASTTEVSRNSLMFGTDTADYKAVQLEIPAGLNINTDNGGYTADLTWTLSLDAI